MFGTDRLECPIPSAQYNHRFDMVKATSPFAVERDRALSVSRHMVDRDANLPVHRRP